MAALLLDAGSDINAQDVVMNTSLHYVVSAEYAKEVKLQLLYILLCYGANCMILGKDDDTPIDAAHANYFLDGIDLMKESLGMGHVFSSEVSSYCNGASATHIGDTHKRHLNRSNCSICKVQNNGHSENGFHFDSTFRNV